MMNSRDASNAANQAISFQTVREAHPDRSYYLKSKIQRIQQFFMRTIEELYHSAWETLSFDHIDLSSFKNAIWPTIAASAAIVVGEYATEYVKTQTENDDYEYIFKFIVGTALLSYAVSHRLTEEKPQTLAELSAATARETLAITYLYTSTFAASRDLFADHATDNAALIMSLGTSGLVVPGLISYAVQKYQTRAVKKAYAKGAQRSDNALFSSGQTPVINTYLQANYFLLTELSSLSRQFQLGLISYNVLNAQKLLQQFRNLPALIIDAGPPTIKNLLAQREKIAKDFLHNTAQQQVLRFTEQGPTFFSVPRYQLKLNDLVWCNDAFDISSVPVSGEMIALQRDADHHFTPVQVPQRFSVNLKSHNGEAPWIEYKANMLDTNFQYVDLHKIRDGKQAGVLTGVKLNFYGETNFFIRVKEEAERNLNNHYQKTAVINQIITQHKKNSVLQALALSAITAVILTQDPEEIPGKALILLFNLYQMMIPFSETFLREMINSRLMKKLNADMKAHLIETIDALRIVDLFAALDGYYLERFPQGVAIVSDKTGTLTTAKMDVLGFWTQDMPLNVQQQLLAKGQSPLYSEDKVDLCFDIFADAYTNNKKELEPEEHAILEFFQNKYLAKNLITVDTLGNDHFRKTISTPKKHGTLETWHLGLCRSLGGRFTLVSENGKKYLVFCGVPRAETFRDTPLLQTYSEMQSRTGVLSRDWCLARTELTESMFTTLHDLFVSDNKAEIENLLSHNVSLLSQLQHHATFLIDNPVKKSAENFIQRCQSINVPVFIATGDTVKAADNIAKVLAPASSKKIAVVRPQQDLLNLDGFTADSTVIFAGVNPELLALFDKLMAREAAQRPVIIFAEMSTENKGILAKHLRDKGYFVVANGDGSNDVAMMKNAHMVIAHLTDDGTYAPGVEQLANLNDKQLRELLGSNASFYELFDIDNPNSLFKKKFIHLANSQEKPSIGLMLKSCKISFELAKTVGLVNVEEMWQQHWFSVAFDLIWLGITFYEIMASKDLPFDNKNLTASSFAKYAQLITLTIGIVQSLMTYTLTGESTNISSMVLMISMLPLVLKSIFSAYGYVRDEAYQKSIAVFGQKNLFTQATEIEEMKEDDDMAPPSASELRNRKEVLNFKPL